MEMPLSKIVELSVSSGRGYEPRGQIDVSKSIYSSIVDPKRVHDSREGLDYALYAIDSHRRLFETAKKPVGVIYSNYNQLINLFVPRILSILETNIKKRKLARKAIKTEAGKQGGLPAVLLREVSELILEGGVENAFDTLEKQAYFYGRTKTE